MTRQRAWYTQSDCYLLVRINKALLNVGISLLLSFIVVNPLLLVDFLPHVATQINSHEIAASENATTPNE
ncbi:hypothetical protein HYQ46_008009 [Verticillium longisporum]|nr:hypothetical protein HYQ46_008009 [Verticillium longisporum]